MSLDAITTKVAHTGANELRFYGHRVFAELLGRTSVAQMLVLGISGTLLDDDARMVIDDVVTVMSSADPRMWPFKIARLASSHGVAAYGTAVSLIAAEGGMFGANRMRAAAMWLIALEEQTRGRELADPELLAILDRGGAGFGVLYRSRDERFEALVRQMERRGRLHGRHMALCSRAVDLGRAERKLEPHVFLAIAAICLDLGLSVDATAAFATILLFHDALANAVEGAAQMPDALRVLPARCLSYNGKSKRISPRAARASLR